MTRAFILVVTAASTFCAGGAAAQAPAPVSEPSRPVLETIVVTAQKRSEDLQDVAMAVAVFDGGALLDAGVTDAMQLQTVVPSLTYVATGYMAQPYLRGIGTRQSTVGLEPSVATYIDDRYVARPFAAMFDLQDVERVEVLKGPQAVLYGRNAAGGAIRAITKDPTDRSVAIVVKAGDYSERRLGIIAGGPFTDQWRGQISATVDRRDGFATNLVASGRAAADDLDRQALRGKLLWDITDTLRAKLGVSWWRYTDWTGRDLTAVGSPEANRGVALYGGVTSRERDAFATALAGDNDLREAAADLRFDARLGDLEFVSVTTYADSSFEQTFDVDASSVTLIDLEASEPSETWTQDFQLLSPESARLPWLAGVHFYRQDASNLYVFRDAVSAQPAFPVGTDVSNGVQHVLTEARALFAEVAYPFSERWRATLGGRWSREQKSATLEPPPGAVTNVPTPYADARTWDDFTPRLSVEYRADFGLAYLSYSRGFKSGGYNYPASVNPVLNPETLDSYELGIKAKFVGDRLRLRSALFHYDFKDLQVSRGGPGAFITTENAASAAVRGVEADVDAVVTDRLSLAAGIALVDSEYTDYIAGVLVPLTVPPYGSAPLPGGLDVRGQSLLRSPDEAAYLGIKYELALARGGRLAVSGDYSYKGDYYFDFSPVAETEWLEQDAYDVLNARVAYSRADGGWEVGVWCTNLTDSSYYEDAVVQSASSRVSYADPRTYGIDFKLRR
ncbi:MAG TPA: TonB-dependent receptor [Gammaproteobacteria bacterium]|nr:TonB-dependent receptor [Gammaproteobacteria bacterium]